MAGSGVVSLIAILATVATLKAIWVDRR